MDLAKPLKMLSKLALLLHAAMPNHENNWILKHLAFSVIWAKYDIRIHRRPPVEILLLSICVLIENQSNPVHIKAGSPEAFLALGGPEKLQNVGHCERGPDLYTFRSVFKC